MGAFFDFLCQVFTHGLPVKARKVCCIGRSAASADGLRAKSEVARKSDIHKHRMAENL